MKIKLTENFEETNSAYYIVVEECCGSIKCGAKIWKWNNSYSHVINYDEHKLPFLIDVNYCGECGIKTEVVE